MTVISYPRPGKETTTAVTRTARSPKDPKPVTQQAWQLQDKDEPSDKPPDST